MPEPLILLSLPALREKDVAAMPQLRELIAGGEIAELTPSFPCVTCPVQAAMSTGRKPVEHGVIGNGFFWRDRQVVEMWTAPNDCIERPQIWDLLAYHGRGLSAAVWFLLHSKGCEADYVCTPSPIHNPDGTESLWCYTRPQELYGVLQDKLGHFPLQHYWGPRAGTEASRWIVDSAVIVAAEWQPDFFHIYLPHLDYAAQRAGPDSPAAIRAVAEMDELIGRLVVGMNEAYDEKLFWLIAGEYVITPVVEVSYPNRVLREAGFLRVREGSDGEHLDLKHSQAFALVDHQFSHIFVADGDPRLTARVADLFRREKGIAEVLVGDQRARYGMLHPRSGEIILISTPDSWQAYYWWLSDEKAPRFARAVDIHRKPGYDPVELFFDPATKGIPLDATLVKGSHGVPADEPSRRTVLLASQPLKFPNQDLADVDVFKIVLKHFGLQ